MNEVLLSSKNMNWCTPQDFFDKLNAEFHFVLDAAATEHSAKCANFFTPETDGLNHNDDDEETGKIFEWEFDLCPVCENHICLREYIFCPYCGQALDRSET